MYARGQFGQTQVVKKEFVDITILPAVSRKFTAHRNGRREISNRLGLPAANTLFLRSDRRESVVCWHRATCSFELYGYTVP